MARGIEKLRDQGTPELNERVRELAEQVFRLRFQLSTGQAEAVTKLHTSALIELGLILFVITLILNMIARLLVWRVASLVPTDSRS